MGTPARAPTGPGAATRRVLRPRPQRPSAPALRCCMTLRCACARSPPPWGARPLGLPSGLMLRAAAEPPPIPSLLAPAPLHTTSISIHAPSHCAAPPVPALTPAPSPATVRPFSIHRGSCNRCQLFRSTKLVCSIPAGVQLQSLCNPLQHSILLCLQLLSFYSVVFCACCLQLAPGSGDGLCK